MTWETNGKPPEIGCREIPSRRAEGVEQPNLEDFEGIYRQYSKRVYSLCLRMTGNKAEAQDLTQEAFFQLFRKLDTFRGDSSFFTWFYRLAVNLVLMEFRRKRRHMETSLEEVLAPENHAGMSPPELSAPDHRLLGTIDSLAIEKALKRLPAGFRLVFVLHDIEGYEHHEIANMVDCTVGTSKSQLHRARLRLRKLLGGRPGGHAPERQVSAGEVLAASPLLPGEALPAL